MSMRIEITSNGRKHVAVHGDSDIMKDRCKSCSLKRTCQYHRNDDDPLCHGYIVTTICGIFGGGFREVKKRNNERKKMA